MSISPKKYIAGLFIFISLILFLGFQLFFLKNIFGIDPFTKDILPKGFCKDCNVILISLDALRAKSLPCYGYSQDTAPNLCEFAKRSFLFKNVYTPSSRTLDSHFSIMTSLYPSSHGMNITFSSVLSDEIITLPQILNKYGYRTLLFQTLHNPNLPIERGFGRGYNYIVNAGTPREWIDNIDPLNIHKQKFFAFLHTSKVHEPYLPKKENVVKFYPDGVNNYITWNELCQKTYEDLKKEHPERFKQNKSKTVDYCDEKLEYEKNQAITLKEFNNLYKIEYDNYWDTFKDMDSEDRKNYSHAFYAASIYELDQELQSFFDYLSAKDLLKNTIIIITSDHGDEFFEHGRHSHGTTLFTEVIHVPLIIYIPRAKPQVIDKLGGSVDIMPSLLSLLGIKVPERVSGINLFSDNENPFVIAQYINGNKESIITKDWQLIVNGGDNKKNNELYDLKKDYEEKYNIASSSPSLVDSLENKLKQYKSSLPKFSNQINQPFPTWVNEKERKKLIETGYF